MNPISIRRVFTDVNEKWKCRYRCDCRPPTASIAKIRYNNTICIHPFIWISLSCCHVMSCHVISSSTNKHETRNTKQEVLLTFHLINLPSQNLEWVSYARCWGMHSLLNLSLPLLKWNMYQYDNMTVVGLLVVDDVPVSCFQESLVFGFVIFKKRETIPYTTVFY